METKPLSLGFARGKIIRRCGFLAAVAILSVLFSSCLQGPRGRAQTSESGYARLHVILGRNQNLLAKSAAADTTFSLDTLIVVLTAPGSSPQTHRYPIAGRPDTGGIVLSSFSFTLTSLRNWKAVFYTIDTTASPMRRDTVHIDSVIFAVLPTDTVDVEKTVSAAFAVLRARYISSFADSLGAGIQYIRLRVNGATQDSLPLTGGVNNAVFFPTVTTGWLAGDSGKAYKSVDSGSSWFPQATGVTENLNSLWFNSATEGWAVGDGGRVLKSNGTSWTTQSTGVTNDLNGTMFVSSSTGYVAGDSGLVLKTVDGGDSWDLMSGGWFPLDGGASGGINGVHFANAGTGWAVGASGLILKTTNSGASWATQTSGVTSNLNGGVAALSTSLAVAVGAGGVVRRTTNGGTSWIDGNSGVTNNLRAVEFVSTSTGWLVGQGGTIRSTNNAGASWTSRNKNGNYRGVTVGPNRVWVVGNTGRIRRSDDLAHNTSFSNPIPSGPIGTTNIFDVDFVTNDIGYVVGADGLVAKTTNGNDGNPSAVSWTVQSTPVSGHLRSVHFADANTGWVAGNDGVILYTTNGGATWTAQESGVSNTLLGLHSVGGDSIFVVGQGHTILKTRSGGVVQTGDENLNAVYFRGAMGYAVGDAGTAYGTTNGGASWSAVTGGTQDLRSVFIYYSGQFVFTVGDAGEYLNASNTSLPSAWTVRSSGTTENLHSIWVSADRIYAAGDGGALRTAQSLNNLTGLSSGTTESLRSVHCQGTSNNCRITGSDEIVLRSTNGTTWVKTTSGARLFDRQLAFKHFKPGISNTVLMQAIDRDSPLRGYQVSASVTVGAGQDSIITYGLTRCGYGGATPACTP